MSSLSTPTRGGRSFAHAAAAYSTGNFTIRTPLDTYTTTGGAIIHDAPPKGVPNMTGKWINAKPESMLTAMGSPPPLNAARLKATLAGSEVEAAESLIFRRPFQAPGLAVLHDDRLELLREQLVRLRAARDRASAHAPARRASGSWMPRSS